MNRIQFLSLFLFYNLLFFKSLAQKPNIENDILAIIKQFRGTVGISIKNLKTNEQINVNETEKYPMQSIYKLPLAMAVFKQIDQGKLSLNQKMNLKKSDLLPNTHSPLLEKYPNGNSEVSLKEILQYTVSQSDNNGCDYLLRLLGGCNKVDKFIKKHQKSGINIVYTEAEMHIDSSFQYLNYAHPVALTSLLEKFYNVKILSKSSTEQLWKMMVETTTAPNRIKGKLPKNTIIGHKSGWSGGDNRGFTNAINDAGIVILPNGEAFVITILIKDTIEKSVLSDDVAAKITKLAYDHFTKK